MRKGDRRLQVPLLPLRGVLIFPAMVMPLEVGRERSVAALEQAMLGDQTIVLAMQKDADIDLPQPEEIFPVGVLARIKQLLRTPEGQIKVLVEGLFRVKVEEYVETDPLYLVSATPLEEVEREGPEVEAAIRAALGQYREYERLARKESGQSASALEELRDPSRLADTIASQLPVAVTEKQRLLEIPDPVERLEALCLLLAREREVLELEKKIHLRVRKQMERSQREYYLREQIKAIQKELGEKDDRASEIEALEKKIEEAGMPEAAREKALHELRRLEKMPPTAAEGVVVRTYLDWLISLPWSKRTTDRHSVETAERILDEEHYGLEKVKERIVEYLAVRQLTKGTRSPILCLVGPPGVGKTSLARSIAKALDRKFVRLSLGGVRDEAEIRGHRRTYVGAMPGKVIQALRQAGTKNPVLLLDEIDKMQADFRGDPAASLLEVLDPEQNHEFADHYLELPFDLSEVLFVTTANLAQMIPRPLLDRLEVISLSGYTAEEKLQIAKRHLVPKQLEEHGLDKGRMRLSDNALRRLIGEYTRESGVRGLERAIGSLCRKVAREVLSGKKRVAVNAQTLEKYLGRPRYRIELSEGRDRIGVAQGLAYTEYGGSLMLVEVSVSKGKGKLLLTGKLGEVMQESAQAAYSFLRSRSEELGIEVPFWEEKDVHVHVPEGAVPKDGPSAGITIAVALASALLGRAVRSDIAMTGEITLRGRVLPIGGVKEKLLAARRAGVDRVILPRENEKELEEVPAEVLRKMQVILVDEVDDVFEAALAPPEGAKSERTPSHFEAALFVPEPESEPGDWIEGNAS